MSPRLLVAILLLAVLLVLALVISDIPTTEVPVKEKPAAAVVYAPVSSTTTTVPAPTSTVPAVARTAPMSGRVVSSTQYCETGRMANGQYAHDGAVSSHVLARGSRWRVLTGPLTGRVFTVEDTGPLAIFDVSVPGQCAAALAYGRKSITIEAA